MVDHDKLGHDPFNPTCIRSFKRDMGKQVVASAVVGKQELGEDFLLAPQKRTTGSAIMLVKGDNGMCVGQLWDGIRKTKANCISF